MVSFFSAGSGVCTLLLILVLELVSVSNVNAASTFTDINISSLTGGDGNAIKAAAAKACGTDLSADELTRRQGLARTAVSETINPQIIEAMKAKNDALIKALTCQKIRTNVLKTTCVLQASIKKSLACETDKYTRKLARGVKAVNRTCNGVNAQLFVNVVGINEPKPLANPPKPCGFVKPREVFTSKFSDVNISLTPGTGDAAKLAADRVCSANLSESELNHRGRLGIQANCFLRKQVKNAGGNVPLQNALECQTIRNLIMSRTCFIQSATKGGRVFASQVNSVKRQDSIDLATKVCATVDPKLFVTVPEPLQRNRGANSTSKANPILTPASVQSSAPRNTSIPSAVFVFFSIYLFS